MSRPVLLVAGGSRGIGAATAKLAGKAGYDVAVNYNSNSNAAASVVAAVKAAGGKAIALQGEWQFRTGDDLAWAKPQVDEARASVAKGNVVSGEDYLKRLAAKTAALKSA